MQDSPSGGQEKAGFKAISQANKYLVLRDSLLEVRFSYGI